MAPMLDRLDRQILHALGVNGRAPFRHLAAVLEATEHTVARRYRTMVKRGVVRVVALPAPNPVDMGQLLRLHIQPGAGPRLAGALTRRDDVSWVRTAGAGTEIVCGLRAHSSAQRDHLILEQLPRTGRVTRVTAHEILHHHRTPGHADWEGFPDPLTDVQRHQLTPTTPADAAPTLTDQDRTLLEALSHDARRTATELAAATGQPRSTVRRRLDALLRAGSIHLDIDIDPAALGYSVNANLYMNVDPKHLHAAGTELSRHDPTTFVAAVTGPANLIAAVAAPTVDYLYRYVSTTLAGVDGIHHIETSITNPYLKHARTVRTTPPQPLSPTS